MDGLRATSHCSRAVVFPCLARALEFNKAKQDSALTPITCAHLACSRRLGHRLATLEFV